MQETFSQYLKRWLSHSTERGLNNPLVKMPVKRFLKLQPFEFDELSNGGSKIIGTTSDPVARNLLKNFKTRISERGEHCAYLSFGSVEIKIAATAGQEEKTALFPVCLKKASLSAAGQNIRATVSDDESWLFNPILKTHLQNFGIRVPEQVIDNVDPGGCRSVLVYPWAGPHQVGINQPYAPSALLPSNQNHACATYYINLFDANLRLRRDLGDELIQQVVLSKEFEI